MEHRNLKRCFTFNRALLKHNKKADHKLSPQAIWVLLSVFNCSQTSPCTISTLYDFLKRNKRTCSTTIIKTKLIAFIEQGWVNASGQHPTKYKLTIDGMNTLAALERRVRNERIYK